MTDIPRKAIPIDTDKLKLWEEANVRKDYSLVKLEELSNNIKENGLQMPLFVKKGKGKDEDKYLVFSGQRRLEACKLIDPPLPKIDCFVFDTINESDARILSFSENLYREQMTTDEISDAALLLWTKYHKNLQRVATILGVTTQTVQKYLDYHFVPDSLKKLGEKLQLKRNEVTKIYSKFPEVSRAKEVIEELGSITSRDVKRKFRAAIRESSSSDDIKKLRARTKQLLNSKEISILLPMDDVTEIQRKADEDDSNLEDTVVSIIQDWVKGR